MDRDRAAGLAGTWAQRHAEGEEPSPLVVEGVERALAERVPEPAQAAAAVPGADGKPLVAVLAAHALWTIWTVGAAGTPDAVRCRRVPLDPATTSVEVSERLEGEQRVRHWWFEVGEDPLVFRTVGDDDAAEHFARALATALGWPAGL